MIQTIENFTKALVRLGAGLLFRRPKPTNGTQSDATKLARTKAFDALAGKPDANYGSRMAFRIEYARNFKYKLETKQHTRRMHELVSTEFNHRHYLEQRPFLAGLQTDLVNNYLAVGSSKGAAPAPWFSDKAYKKRYPSTRENPFYHYLHEGKAAGHVAEPWPDSVETLEAMGIDPEEGLAMHRALYEDLSERLETGELGKQVRLMAEIEPLVSDSWFRNLFIPPLSNEPMTALARVVLQIQEAVDYRSARFVIAVERPADPWRTREVDLLVNELARSYGPQSLVVLDLSRDGTGFTNRTGEDIRHVKIGKIFATLPANPNRQLVDAIRNLRPEMLFIFESDAMFTILQLYGGVLAQEMKVVSFILNTERSRFGYEIGSPHSQFYNFFHHFHRVVTSTQHMKRLLSETFLLPEQWQQRISVIKVPANPALAALAEETISKPQAQTILWVGKADDRDRIELAFEIAQLMPDVSFHCYTDLQEQFHNPDHAGPFLVEPENVTFFNMIDTLDGLALEAYAACLYTSDWDGTDSLLLDLAAAGLPLIASKSASITLEDGLSPVEDSNTPQTYAEDLRQVLTNPLQARISARKLSAQLAANRAEKDWSQPIISLVETASCGYARAAE
ncbi:hypothetical protein [uncultured Cohaesibacter sp.]|uniref:hypothetical protein n=1 Tax=uncultured Cohaesibacter sp. TaxID=1002546 RepID=UPI0029C68E7B|nr:hypothetical protein [uncultured Cohaesibacter sp.]